MSTQSSEPSGPSDQERALQAYLLGTTVPLKDGGGVVFPNGLLGVGYRLDEWQLDRYRSAVDRSMLSPEALRRRKVMIGTLIAYLAVIVAVAFALPLLQRDPDFAPYLDVATPLLVMLVAAGATLTALRFLRSRSMRFTKQLEGASKVGCFAYLRERSLALLISGAAAVPALAIRVVVYGGLAVFLLFSQTFAAEHPALRIVLGVILLFSAAKRAYLLFVYWSFRRRHGRAPTPEDLQPVEAPPLRAG